MRVSPNHNSRSYTAYRHTGLVHFVDQRSYSGRHQVGCPTRYTLANVADIGTVLVSGVFKAELVQDVAAVAEGSRLIGLDFRNVFGKELSSFEQQIGALSIEEPTGLCVLYDDQAGQFAHVHARDHLLLPAIIVSHKQVIKCDYKRKQVHLQLPATVYTVLVDLAIKLGPDKVDAAVVTESTPLRVDEDVLLLGARFVVKKLRVLNRLHVASVAAST